MISALSPNIKLLNKDENEIFKNFQRNYNFSRNSALFGLQLHSRIMNCQYQANPKSESPVLSKPNWFSLFLFLWNVFDNNGKLIFWACVPIQVFIRFLNTDWKMLLPPQIVSQLLLVPRRFGIFEGKEPVPQWANNYKQSNHVYTWMTCGCFEFCKLLLSKLYEN